MPELTKEGRYLVRIVDASYRQMEKKDDGSFVVSLRLETPDGYHCYYDMLYTHAIISGGKNSGLTVAEASTNLLIELGVPDGYLGNLLKVIQEKSIEAEAVLKWEEYDGKRRLKVAYLNPPRKIIPLAEVNIDEVLAQFNNKNKNKKQEVEKNIQDKNDEIPF